MLVLAIPGWPLFRRLRRARARGGGHALVSWGARPRERPDRRPHRRRQHLTQARRGAARRGRQVRRTDGQTGLRRLDQLAPEQLAQRAAEVRRPADAPDRQHHRQELHRLGADHRRDGPALLRQRRRLRAGLQRQRLHLAGDPPARLRPHRLRDGAAQDARSRCARPWTGSSSWRTCTTAARSRSRRPRSPRTPSRAASRTCAAFSSARSTAPRTTTAGPRSRRSPTTSPAWTRRSRSRTTARPSSSTWSGPRTTSRSNSPTAARSGCGCGRVGSRPRRRPPPGRRRPGRRPARRRRRPRSPCAAPEPEPAPEPVKHTVTTRKRSERKRQTG